MSFEPLRDALAATYALEDLIGRGGMADVYAATDRRHGRRVAVKVIRPDAAGAPDARRFLQEIAVAARLAHPHILPVFDSGQAGDLLYYVMPYVDGASLRQRLDRDRRLPVADAVRIASEIADALQHAHGHGLVHRDIKPENILLQSGHALLADFGIARVTDPAASQSLTRTGVFIGTPAYTSPEQAAGDAALDHRSDIYSLACVLHEMLTGRPPHADGSAAEVLTRRLTEPARSARTLRPEVTPALDAALLRALARRPGDRFESAAAFAGALAAEDHAAAPPPLRTILVLPFVNRSPAGDDEYFSDGLTDELIADLSRIRSIRVISRASAHALKGTTRSIRELGRELDVQCILTGTVRRAGDQLRVTAELVDTATDVQVWSARHTGTLDDVFEVQERLSRAIVGALAVELTPAEDRRLAERPIVNVHAYESYLRARAAIWRFDRAALDEARANLEAALGLVGPNALLLATLGWIESQYLEVGAPDGADQRTAAEEHSRQALAISADSPLALALTGRLRFQRGDVQGAIHALRPALILEPHNPDILLMLSYGYMISGRTAEAMPLLERLQAVDPLMPLSVNLRGFAEFLEGRLDRALPYYRRMYDLAPDSPASRLFLAWLLAAAGRSDELAAMTARLPADAPGGGVLDDALRFLARCSAGDHRGADAAMTPALSEAASRTEYLARMAGDGYALLGRHDEAISWMETSVRLGFIHDEYLRTHSPFARNLRGHPRFERLLEDVRRRAAAFQTLDLDP